MASYEGTAEDMFVDAETDLEGVIRAIVAEQMVATETRLKSWMKMELNKLLNDMKALYGREQRLVSRGVDGRLARGCMGGRQ